MKYCLKTALPKKNEKKTWVFVLVERKIDTFGSKLKKIDRVDIEDFYILEAKFAFLFSNTHF